jgi:hypothetical protein
MRSLLIASIVSAAGLQACSSAPVDLEPAVRGAAADEDVPVHAAAQGEEPSIDQIRAATERFKGVKVALAEGYARDPMDECATSQDMGKPAALGGMGIHYANRKLQPLLVRRAGRDMVRFRRVQRQSGRPSPRRRLASPPAPAGWFAPNVRVRTRFGNPARKRRTR